MSLPLPQSTLPAVPFRVRSWSLPSPPRTVAGTLAVTCTRSLPPPVSTNSEVAILHLTLRDDICVQPAPASRSRLLVTIMLDVFPDTERRSLVPVPSVTRSCPLTTDTVRVTPVGGFTVVV